MPRSSPGPHPQPGDARKLLVTESKKTDRYAWMNEIPVSALYKSIDNGGKAYENFFASITGKRRGKPVGAPTFKKRCDAQPARFSEQSFRIRGRWQNTQRGGGRLHLARIGHIHVNWHRPLPTHPSSVTIIEKPDGTYWASFVVKITRTVTPPCPSGTYRRH